MNRRTALGGIAAGIGVLAGSARAQPAVRAPRPGPARIRRLFDDGWRFTIGDPAGAHLPDFDDSAWRPLTLPHDWSIEGPFDSANPSGSPGAFAPAGIGWYRKTFPAPGGGGRSLLVEFDGVYQNPQVWINGHLLGGRSYGFLGFTLDLTPYLNPGGVNLLAVRVDNSRQPNCRWYTGSGINRHVWLTATGSLRIAPWGVGVTATPGGAVHVSTSVTSGLAGAAACRIETRIIDPSGMTVASGETGATLAASVYDFAQDFTVPAPQLWSPDSPVLYRAAVTVFQDGAHVDDYTVSFGIRSVVFDPVRGLLLNGQPVKLKGLCLHENFACLGSAIPGPTIARQLDILKSLGCNAVRLCHNPHNPHTLDLCDRKGLLVIAEAFDKWDLGTSPEFERPDFAATWQTDLRDMLRRDRNHPSIVLWSVGNEAGLPGTEPHDSTLASLVDFVHQEEPSRSVTCAIIPQIHGTVEDIVRTTLSAAAKMDVLSVNYQEQRYELYRAASPSLVIAGTESYPYFHGIPNGYDTVNNWYSAAAHAWVAGQFVWVGFDYLGESTGWPSKGWPNGLIDSTGSVKPSAFFHQAVWTAQPLVRLSVAVPVANADPGLAPWSTPPAVAHWNFPPANAAVLAVSAPSNCETVELLVNGTSYGVQQVSAAPNATPTWYVRYAPGTLEAIARNQGQVVARDRLATSGAAAAIALSADRALLTGDGQDVAHLEISLVDAAGALVPDADRVVTLRVDGAARLLGMDNGDLRDPTPYRGPSRATSGGRCLAVVAAQRARGQATVTASAPNLPSVILPLSVV